MSSQKSTEIASSAKSWKTGRAILRLETSASADRLVELLVREILGWTVAPDRYILRGRNWIARWRFSPLCRVEDALTLLDQGATNYTLQAFEDGSFTACVRVGRSVGVANGKNKAAVMTVAIARAKKLVAADEFDTNVLCAEPTGRPRGARR